MSPVRFVILLVATLLVSVTMTTERVDGQKLASLPPETAKIVEQAGGIYDPPRHDVRLVVLSDLNEAYGSTSYPPEVGKGIDLIPYWNPDLVLCGGDMVAGQSRDLSKPEIEAMWEAFDDYIAHPLRERDFPFGFTMGNHDGSAAQGEDGSFIFHKDREVASAYWNHPDHDPGLDFIDRADFPFYYTFQHQDIFFLVWDGSSHRIRDHELAWVEDALASPQAQSAKMRVVLGHLPLYGIAEGRNQFGEVMENSQQLQAMMEKYDVHTYISGHHHAYYPGHRGNLQLLNAGLLGAGARSLIDNETPLRKALTVVDIDFDSSELTTYATYDINSLDLIEYEELPRFLAGYNGAVMRRDIEWEDLNASEQEFCEKRLGKELCSF
ncbi:metallophosphoesterase [Euhalothece natronophila Z-M001]|uniref:Metallophosphoesterase n=1 Tax=Euhalothece natronophila Z-M001 TaxID=522448 RepID=A0A5B8NQP1_9CHRO|nr:metallophosphoesterase [Euhalothece natronophila]QDZ41318.1 metallophosphoesterase [Euhalothece natronophila Z-M001]